MEQYTEKRVETYLVERIAALGGWALKLPAVFVTGLPDRLVLIPGGRVAFAELKAPGKTPRQIQIHRHLRLRAMGFHVEVLDSFEAVNKFVASL